MANDDDYNYTPDEDYNGDDDEELGASWQSTNSAGSSVLGGSGTHNQVYGQSSDVSSSRSNPPTRTPFGSSASRNRFGSQSNTSNTPSQSDIRRSGGYGGGISSRADQQVTQPMKTVTPRDLNSNQADDDDAPNNSMSNRIKSAAGGMLPGRKNPNHDKPSDDKPDDGGILQKLGGLFSKKDKSDDKPDNSKTDNDTSEGRGFSIRRMWNRDDSDKPADNKPASDPPDKLATSAIAALTVGLTRPFRRSRLDDSDDKEPEFSNIKSSDNKQSRFGARQASKENDNDDSGGLWSRFRRGRNESSDTTKQTRPTKAARTPKTVGVESSNWLDLDRKLDLVGVGLVFGSILLFFSAMSREQAAISFVHNLIGQLLGWGAIAVPLTMFAVGIWLIVRHFGDDAPTVDPIRLAGLVIGFFGLLTLFQYAESFSYIESIPQIQRAVTLACSTVDAPDTCVQDIVNISECSVSITDGCLEGLIKYSYQQNSGGGLIGGWLYLSLIHNLTEIGGFVVVVMVLTFALMMVTRLSMAEIAVVTIGIGRSLRTSMAQNAARRRAQQLKEAQQKAIAAEAASISVSKPAPEQLPGFQANNALPEPTEESDILIRRGGQAFSSNEPNPEATSHSATPAQPSRGRRFGRLFGRNKENPTQQQPNPIGTASAGIMGRLFNRDSNTASQPVAQTQATQANTQPVAQTQATQTHAQPVDQTQATQTHAQPVAQTQDPQTHAQPVDQTQTTQAHAQPVDQTQATQTRAQPVDQTQDPQTRTQPVDQTQDPTPAPSVIEQHNNSQHVQNTNDYNAFGRPNDIPTHESENLPGQQFSSTTPITTRATPQVNQPSNTVQKPVSTAPTNQTKARNNWKLPDYRTLLSSGSEQEFDREHLLNLANTIEETLSGFGAPGRVVEINTGPVITQFGVEPGYLTARSGKKSRVKVSAIAQLDKDLQLALGAKSIRVEAPVPGKGYVGIEVPNAESSLVSLRDVMESTSFQKVKTPLAIALGMSVDGTPISADLTQMPHLLIAGTTGSGKSVCVNAIINSIVATNSPDKVKFIMVDPKRVELTGYNGLPHLIAPVVVELERTVGVLKWVTREMDERYKKFSNMGARNIIDYNKNRDAGSDEMPYIVVIIDELADLMMLAPEDTERAITRIAALARATGIHLVLATQRPSVDVVTGLIKANFPARIAFAVAGGVDSRVILDQPGAERLLGKGDMLYLSGDSPAPLRLQGVFVSDMEINNITRYWKTQSLGVETVKPIPKPTLQTEAHEPATQAPTQHTTSSATGYAQQTGFWDPSSDEGGELDPNKLGIEAKTGNPDPQEDDLYQTAVDMVRRLDKASISLLQRRLRIGYTRAARLVDMMEERGVIGPAKEGSSKPRDVIPE
jgi:DNA segregation ATPase FtsK/SpoIIIE-like protein